MISRSEEEGTHFLSPDKFWLIAAIKVFKNSMKIFVYPSKNKPLGKQARKHNKELSKRRILVENKIRQMKVFQILAQTYRNRLASYSQKTAIIAGLVNMKNEF